MSLGCMIGPVKQTKFVARRSYCGSIWSHEVGSWEATASAASADISGEKVMKNIKYLLVILLAAGATCWAVAGPTNARATVSQTQASTALERGYRTGYSDGYQAGYKDQSDRAARDYGSKDEYQKADRAYVDAWGPIEDYRDGYQQGYENGYGAGYERQSFSSSLPAGFKRRGLADARSGGANADPNQNSSSSSSTGAPADAMPNVNGNISIPRDTILIVELENALSSDDSQRGDQFRARVIEPREYAGAVIDGRVTRVQKAGKVRGTAQLQLSFDQIRAPDGRSTNLHAEIVEILPGGGNDSVGEVDREGGVKGKSSTKDDVAKVGATTGVGAIIGAIVGGGKGAAIGAAIGAGVGTGGVLSSPGKDVRLARGQQLKIRTSTDTSIQ